jgi:hypothetical protein
LNEEFVRLAKARRPRIEPYPLQNPEARGFAAASDDGLALI